MKYNKKYRKFIVDELKKYTKKVIIDDRYPVCIINNHEYLVLKDYIHSIEKEINLIGTSYIQSRNYILNKAMLKDDTIFIFKDINMSITKINCYNNTIIFENCKINSYLEINDARNIIFNNCKFSGFFAIMSNTVNNITLNNCQVNITTFPRSIKVLLKSKCVNIINTVFSIAEIYVDEEENNIFSIKSDTLYIDNSSIDTPLISIDIKSNDITINNSIFIAYDNKITLSTEYIDTYDTIFKTNELHLTDKSLNFNADVNSNIFIYNGRKLGDGNNEHLQDNNSKVKKKVNT